MIDGRTKKAVKNIGSNFGMQVLKTIFAFLTRTIFIHCLGKEALGLNSLFTNILSMLSLAELGISNAINFSLYKPLAEKDYEKVSSLMSFYRKTYTIIGFVVGILGICLIPLLDIFIKNIDQIENIYYIYLLFLFNTVSSYFISYKETLITADQKNYKLVGIQTIFLIILNVLQIIFLLLFKNFILYLIIQLLVQFIQKIVCNIYITKQYELVDFNTKKKIDSLDFKVIKKNVKAMIFHKIGDYCVNSTDNLIISSFISVTLVGLYSNYLTILSMITTFTSVFYSNLTSGLGNLVAKEETSKTYGVFKKMDFIGFVMYGFCSVVLINVFNNFITLWIGEGYCLDFKIILAIIVSFYISGMRVPSYTIKSAAGLYDIDKFSSIIQSIINLVVSIVLVNKIGLIGVILGTIISGIAVPSWQRPYIVYKYVLKKPFSRYIKSYLKNFSVIFMIGLMSLILNSFIVIDNLFILFLIKIVNTIIIYLIVIILVYRKTEEYQFLIISIKNIILKIKKKQIKEVTYE